MIGQMRGADKSALQGYYNRNARRPLYVLINMGNNRVAFGRAGDLLRSGARESIARSRKKSYPLEQVISDNIRPEQLKYLQDPNWTAVQLREEEIQEAFRGKKEPLQDAMAKFMQGKTQPVRATLVGNGFLGIPIMVYPIAR